MRLQVAWPRLVLVVLIGLIPIVISQREYEDVEVPEDIDYTYNYDGDPTDDAQQERDRLRNRNRDPNPFRSNTRNPNGGFRVRNPNSGGFRVGEDDIFDDDRPPGRGFRLRPDLRPDDDFGRDDGGGFNRVSTSTRNPFRGFQSSTLDPKLTPLRTTTVETTTTTPKPTTSINRFDRNRFGGGFQPFTTTTEDPFRRPDDPFRSSSDSANRFRTSTISPRDPFNKGADPNDPYGPDREDANNFQNNEVGNNDRPTNPFGLPPLRSRPQVDEFGNPLEDIRSVDTTRFELGEGVEADEVKCPRNWIRFRESCYKFTRSPIKRWDDARMNCQAYRHQDQVMCLFRLFFASQETWNQLLISSS